MIDIETARRKSALDKLNSGDAKGAAALLRDMIGRDRDNADLIGLLGIALEESGDIEGGADALRRATDIPADTSITFRNVGNLAALLFDNGGRDEAAELLRRGWVWPAHRVPGAKECGCMALIGETMRRLGLNAEAVALLLPVINAAHHNWPILKHTMSALEALGQHEEALALLEQTPTPGTDERERQALRACLLLALNRRDDAATALRSWLAGAPAYIEPERFEQLFTVGIVSPMGVGPLLKASERAQHFSYNYPSQLAALLGNRFRFASILFGAGPSAIDRFCASDPKVVINNVVNAEFLLAEQNLAKTQQLAEAAGVPVLNTPENAARYTRQMNCIRLQGLANAVVPKVSRFNRDPARIDKLIAEIEASFAYPMIVRTVSDQDAMNVVRTGDRSALCETLLRFKQKQVYVIQYVGATRREGLFRRMRAAYVGGTPIVMRADYAAQWIVQGRKHQYVRDTYRGRADLLADANDIILRPEARLGKPAMATLAAIGRLVPLDICGVDFDVDDEGRVVFFEANATMNLCSTAAAELPYPPEPDAALINAIEQLLLRRANLNEPAIRLHS